MDRVCITNDIRDMRPCIVPGEHLHGCDGFAYRWADETSERERDTRIVRKRVERHERVTKIGDGGKKVVAWERVEVECPGCLPREAEHGYLCWSCWKKTEDALSIAHDMITHLRSVERAQQIDTAGIRARAGWVVPVPMTWRTADELLMLLGHPTPGFPKDAGVFEVDAIVERTMDALDVDRWVNTPSGAGDAVRFYLLMQRAMSEHPMAEYEHRVRNVRCYKCRRLTLVWKPPLMFAPADPQNRDVAPNPDGMVRVVCSNEKCGAELDQVMYERLAVLEETAKPRRKSKEEEVTEP